MARRKHHPDRYRRYLDESRDEIIRALRMGVKHDAIALKFRVHPSTVSRYLKFLRREGIDV